MRLPCRVIGPRLAGESSFAPRDPLFGARWDESAHFVEQALGICILEHPLAVKHGNETFGNAEIELA